MAAIKRRKTGKKDPSFTAKDAVDVEYGNTESVKVAPTSTKKKAASPSKHD